jgi:hypothetical protein
MWQPPFISACSIMHAPQGALSTKYFSTLPWSDFSIAWVNLHTLRTEKFHAMVFHGEINSRMKDFFDIWGLATHFHFDGQTLTDAVRATFQYRQSEIQVTPVALTDAFASRDEKQAQWAAFIRRLSLDGHPPALGDVVQLLASFLQPITVALSEHRLFDQHWPPGGPWQKKPV